MPAVAVSRSRTAASSGIASLRDVEAAEAAGLPADLPDSTLELIRRSASRHPELPALSFFLRAEEHRHPQTWTYRELLEEIIRTANFFDELGAGKDTVIAFVLPNLPQTHFTIWGGEASGIVFAINPLLEASAIAELLHAAGAQLLVTLAPFPGTDLWPKLAGVIGQVPSLRHVVQVNLATLVRGWKRVPAWLAQRREARRLRAQGEAALPPGVQLHDFTQGLRRQDGKRLRSARVIAGSDVSSYFCTGGTTGLPKIAVRSHRNEVANAWSAAQFLGDSVGPGRVIFCGLPLFHVNGVLVTGLLPFAKGAHVILGTPQGYRGAGVVPRFWEIVAHHRVNFFSAVPTLYAALLQVPTQGHDIGSLEYGLCGAAPMPVEVFRSFQERTGLKILEGYGLTEGSCVSSVNPPLGERRLGSIGLRIPGQQMKTVHLDEAGRYCGDCVAGEVGALLISGANVFQGYKIEAQNRNLWVDCGDGLRWLNTGDLARQDAEGYFWLTGRKKELIIRGGHNIDPASIEEPLHRHPAVQIAAAVGRPDAHAGELPVAYVQLKPGAQLDEAELLAFLKREIQERAALPKAVRIIEQMPLTGVGKIFKPALKLRETREALLAALTHAGLTVSALEVRDDKDRGLCVQLSASATHAPEIRRVLGQFPFAFDIHTGSP